MARRCRRSAEMVKLYAAPTLATGSGDGVVIVSAWAMALPIEASKHSAASPRSQNSRAQAPHRRTVHVFPCWYRTRPARLQGTSVHQRFSPLSVASNTATVQCIFCRSRTGLGNPVFGGVGA